MYRTCTTIIACLTLLTLPIAAADFPLGPGAPGDLAASGGPGAGEITLTWSAAESLGGVTSYQVYRLAEDGNTTLVGATDGATLTFTETGLASGVAYTYVVTASDLAGEGPASAPATATTLAAPGAPQDVAATPGPLGTIGEIVVTWQPPADDGGLAIFAYHVYRDGIPVATLGADATGWTDSGRDLTTPHTYAVSAQNDAGEGAQSDGSCAYASPGGTLLACGTLG